MLWLIIGAVFVYGIPLAICVTLMGILTYLDCRKYGIDIGLISNVYLVLLFSFVPLINLKVMLRVCEEYTRVKRRTKP